MSATDTPTPRPLRADAHRNREAILAAARAAFTETGASTALEAIARRAGVGIGTLYRHFPTRPALLEAVYVDEVRQLARAAAELETLPPWPALEAWLRRLCAYLVTKHALAAELLDHLDRGADVFASCRAELFAAGTPLIERARAAGAVRTDVELADIVQMVGAIAKIPSDDPDSVGRILTVALDGLRPAPQAAG
ncbi:TetR/AcrR family transcriptional regulator [Conexibacter sp. DBS9H8]|uniref:TetR/AcrR family transcriptional regulator n=1 Tax=Conexibacter sp. DBS9H8 TaxID=2937801 RepID=UPI00200E943B|nr:TetR/AcrR family transcriptional regulator [Conexibacter sp. DBS9H8]